MILDLLARYWAKVDRRGDDDCWPWKGSRTLHGYGQLANGQYRRNRAERSLATHIALYVDGKPRPSADHLALHRCDNPRCVNPRHLWWGTHADNMADMIAKGRSAAQIAAAEAMDAAAATLGTRTGHVKLTEADVRRIRASEQTTIALAAELGVTNQCVSDIRRRRTWAHIE